ncbi:MAG TPA: hypothetical protein VF017_22460 [Thermoanaerobaculia bacterium]|nr:hypothetical protein [Thermoanaerobaculia bacterium]
MVAQPASPAPRPSFREACVGSSTPAARRSSLQFSAWTLVWALSFLAATFLLKREVVAGALAWVTAAVPGLLGLVTVAAYRRFLRSLDELQRRIQLEGLALGFGAGILFSMCWRLFERAGAPQLDISDSALVMLGFWVLGQLLGYRRYA